MMNFVFLWIDLTPVLKSWKTNVELYHPRDLHLCRGRRRLEYADLVWNLPSTSAQQRYNTVVSQYSFEPSVFTLEEIGINWN